MATDDKMALLAGLVAMTVDGTLFAGGFPGQRHHRFEQIARASGVDIAARWSAPIGLFDKMRRAAMIDLLREECGAPSAENCASIKKKGRPCRERVGTAPRQLASRPDENRRV